MGGVFKLEYFHIDGAINLWNFSHYVVNINPRKPISATQYTFSSPSVNSDLNRK